MWPARCSRSATIRDTPPGVRQTIVITSGPLPSQPARWEAHALRPLTIYQSPSGTAVVRTPSAGGGAAKLAVPSGSLNAMVGQERGDEALDLLRRADLVDRRERDERSR